jgi:hypothetical protein
MKSLFGAAESFLACRHRVAECRTVTASSLRSRVLHAPRRALPIQALIQDSCKLSGR